MYSMNKNQFLAFFGVSAMIVLGVSYRYVSIRDINWIRTIQAVYSYPAEWNQVKYVWMPTNLEKSTLKPLIIKRYANRRKILKKFCSEKNSSEKVLPQQLVSALHGNLTVCFIQKAASTSWNRLVWRLRHKVPEIPDDVTNIRSDNLQIIKKLNYKEKKKLVKSSLSVVSVRHPFARLISGWNNKLNREFVRTHGNHLLRTMPQLINYLEPEEESKEHVVSFQRFLALIINLSKNRTREQWISDLDSHFRPMIDICQPCDFAYKYIVKLESAPDDLWYVLDLVNVNMTSFISQSNVTATSWASKMDAYEEKMPVIERFELRTVKSERELSSAIAEYFRNIPRNYKKRLLELYRSDFDAFGYSYDLDKDTAGGLL